jgi:hypothetical protein
MVNMGVIPHMALYFKPAKKIEFTESRSQIKPLDQIQLDMGMGQNPGT